jgi:COMPASS component SPP1
LNSNDDFEDDEDDVDMEEAETEHEETEDLGSQGGVLTAGDLKAIVSRVKSAKEFRELGESLLPPPPTNKKPPSPLGRVDAAAENGGTRNDLGIDFELEAQNIQFNPEESNQIQMLRNKRTELRNRAEMLRDRDRFLALVRQHAKAILERLRQADSKGGASAWKDICGFDSRLSWSDEEFNDWRLSDAGKKALSEGVLDAVAPVTGEGGSGSHGDIEMPDADADSNIDTIARGICIKKRCERHKQWVRVHQQDILFEQSTVKEQLAKCERDAKDVVERVVLRVYGDENGDAAGYG